MLRSSRLRVLWTLVLALFTGSASADVFNMPTGQTSLQMLSVGDAGNAADTNGRGAVAYDYQIGKFEVTVAQYVAFLNTVAKSDPYGLWNANMAPGPNEPSISRVNAAGSYQYVIQAGFENHPISNITWGDAARFVNWLGNGQPTTGGEAAGTTETGSYTLNGATSASALMAITRSPSATYVIPTQNEWYKAAYYKAGSTHAGYWLYPTQSDTPPTNVFSTTATNNANYYDQYGTGNGSWTLTGIQHLTNVGAFAGSPSAYGTFDQAGNVWEWDEAKYGGTYYGIRGSSFSTFIQEMKSDATFYEVPAAINDEYGFRVAAVPEPSLCGVFVLASAMMVVRRTSRCRGT